MNLATFIAVVLILPLSAPLPSAPIAQQIMAPTGILHHDYFWTGDGGATYTNIDVDTVKQLNETDTHWKRRHIDEIENSWLAFPPQ